MQHIHKCYYWLARVHDQQRLRTCHIWGEGFPPHYTPHGTLASLSRLMRCVKLERNLNICCSKIGREETNSEACRSRLFLEVKLCCESTDGFLFCFEVSINRCGGLRQPGTSRYLPICAPRGDMAAIAAVQMSSTQGTRMGKCCEYKRNMKLRLVGRSVGRPFGQHLNQVINSLWLFVVKGNDAV